MSATGCESVGAKQNLIKIHLERNVFFPGDVVRGRIAINVFSMTKIRAFRIRLGVKEWVTTGGGHNRPSQSLKCSLYKHLITAEGCTKQLEVAMSQAQRKQRNKSGGANTTTAVEPLSVAKGTYSYPFEFQLPVWVPPTFLCEGEGDAAGPAGIVGFIKAYTEELTNSVVARSFFRIVGVVPQQQYYQLLSRPLSSEKKIAYTTYCCAQRSFTAKITATRIVRLDTDAKVSARIDVSDEGASSVRRIRVRLEHVIMTILDGHKDEQRMIVCEVYAEEVDGSSTTFNSMVGNGGGNDGTSLLFAPVAPPAAPATEKTTSVPRKNQDVVVMDEEDWTPIDIELNGSNNPPGGENPLAVSPAPAPVAVPPSLSSSTGVSQPPAKPAPGTRSFLASLPVDTNLPPTVIGITLRSYYQITAEFDVPFGVEPYASVETALVQSVQPDSASLPPAKYVEADTTTAASSARKQHVTPFRCFVASWEALYRFPPNPTVPRRFALESWGAASVAATNEPTTFKRRGTEVGGPPAPRTFVRPDMTKQFTAGSESNRRGQGGSSGMELAPRMSVAGIGINKAPQAFFSKPRASTVVMKEPEPNAPSNTEPALPMLVDEELDEPLQRTASATAMTLAGGLTDDEGHIIKEAAGVDIWEAMVRPMTFAGEADHELPALMGAGDLKTLDSIRTLMTLQGVVVRRLPQGSKGVAAWPFEEPTSKY